jgi:hypothetical protein
MRSSVAACRLHARNDRSESISRSRGCGSVLVRSVGGSDGRLRPLARRVAGGGLLWPEMAARTMTFGTIATARRCHAPDCERAVWSQFGYLPFCRDSADRRCSARADIAWPTVARWSVWQQAETAPHPRQYSAFFEIARASGRQCRTIEFSSHVSGWCHHEALHRVRRRSHSIHDFESPNGRISGRQYGTPANFRRSAGDSDRPGRVRHPRGIGHNSGLVGRSGRSVRCVSTPPARRGFLLCPW